MLWKLLGNKVTKKKAPVASWPMASSFGMSLVFCRCRMNEGVIAFWCLVDGSLLVCPRRCHCRRKAVLPEASCRGSLKSLSLNFVATSSTAARTVADTSGLPGSGLKVQLRTASAKAARIWWRWSRLKPWRNGSSKRPTVSRKASQHLQWRSSFWLVLAVTPSSASAYALRSRWWRRSLWAGV